MIIRLHGVKQGAADRINTDMSQSSLLFLLRESGGVAITGPVKELGRRPARFVVVVSGEFGEVFLPELTGVRSLVGVTF